MHTYIHTCIHTYIHTRRWPHTRGVGTGGGGLERAEAPQLFGWGGSLCIWASPNSRNPNLQTLLRSSGAVSQNKLGDETWVAQSTIRHPNLKKWAFLPIFYPLASPSWGGGPAPPAICIGSTYTPHTRDLIPQCPYTYPECYPQQLFILITQLRRKEIIIKTQR